MDENGHERDTSFLGDAEKHGVPRLFLDCHCAKAELGNTAARENAEALTFVRNPLQHPLQSTRIGAPVSEALIRLNRDIYFVKTRGQTVPICTGYEVFGEHFL